MQVPSVPPPASAPPAPASTSPTPDGFGRTLAAALTSAGPRTGRGLTLGQMLRTPVLGAAALAPAVALPSAVAPPSAGVVAPGPGGGLGVGPLARPLPAAVGSRYGSRLHPIHGDVRMHHGVDLGAATGSPIRAFAAGTVVFSGPRGGYGNLIEIDHGNGITTRYAHQSANDVRPGDVVAAGEVIGRVGATGTATGPHLHFEIRRDGASLDPAPYLP
jgi:murein DD-endopeptidase MepM/ murein hydrolase activator NlpD